MAKGLVDEQNLQDIADAIRTKLGVTTTYLPSEMAAAILLIGKEIIHITITQSENQTITVTCNGTAHTSDFDVVSGDTYTATVSADDGYVAGELSIADSGTFYYAVTFSAAEAYQGTTMVESLDITTVTTPYTVGTDIQGSEDMTLIVDVNLDTSILGSTYIDIFTFGLSSLTWAGNNLHIYVIDGTVRIQYVTTSSGARYTKDITMTASAMSRLKMAFTVDYDVINGTVQTSSAQSGKTSVWSAWTASSENDLTLNMEGDIGATTYNRVEIIDRALTQSELISITS